MLAAVRVHPRLPAWLVICLQEVKLPSIAGTVIANSNLNLLGMGATIIALQVGGRVGGQVGGLLYVRGHEWAGGRLQW